MKSEDLAHVYLCVRVFVANFNRRGRKESTWLAIIVISK